MHSFVVLAVETGMRFGELAGVLCKHVDFNKRTIYLPDTKNGQARTVPLSTRALAAIQILPRSITGRLFTVKPGSIRSAFLIAVQKAKSIASLRISFSKVLRPNTPSSCLIRLIAS